MLRIVPITGQHGRDGDDAFRARTVYTRDEPRVWNDQNRDKGRHWLTSAIRTGKGDGDTTLSTAQHWPIQMNYDDYYTRQVGGALPYFTGARVQRGHGFGSLFSGLLRSVAPLIKRGALALGKRALTTGAQIAGDVVAGQNIKKATKRRATTAGRALMSSLLATPPPSGKRIKRTAPSTKRIKRTAAHRRTSPTKRQDNDRTYYPRMAFVHRQSCEGGVKSKLDLFAVPPTQTSIEEGGWIEHQPPIGWPDRIHLARNRRCVSRSRQHISTRTRENSERKRNRRWRLYTDGALNNWLHSLFSQVDVYLNDTLATSSSNTYPFRSYVETLLSYGAEAKKTQLTSQGLGRAHGGYDRKCRQPRSG